MDTKKWVAGAVLASAAVGGAYGVIAEDKARAAAPAKPQAAPEAPVAEVVVRELAPSIELTGSIAAIESVAVRPRISGFIETVAFPEGGWVRKGQVLFQLDARPFHVALARAQAGLAQARAQRTLAEQRLLRGDKLAGDAVISASTHDGLIAEAENARAAVAAASSAVRAAELELSYTRVLAPIDGRVGEARVDAGNLVSGGNDGATLLAEIVSAGPVHVALDVDEPTYRRLLAGKRDAQGRIAGADVALGLAGEDGFPHAAKLDYVANTLDASSGTARVRATAGNERDLLVPGLFARVRLSIGEPRAAVLIDDRAVGTDQEGRYVLVVNEHGVIEQRHVELDASAFGLRIVNRGLEAGDRVVMGGMARPGMQIKPRPVSMLRNDSPLAQRNVP
jgi:gold/copper resistance efflux system membrane fusion protein